MLCCADGLTQNTAPLYTSFLIFACFSLFRFLSISLSCCLSSLAHLLFYSCAKIHGWASHDILYPHILSLSFLLYDNSQSHNTADRCCRLPMQGSTLLPI